MSSPKILVVDDDAESRGLICEVLESNGYAVGAVEDGVAARKALKQEGEYRIVIADLRMPNESGLDLLRNLRQQIARHDIALILMSSFISGTERKFAQELGVHAMLEKPFRLSELLQVVGELSNENKIGIAP
jgi:two-component system, OmpR family, response regulator